MKPLPENQWTNGWISWLFIDCCELEANGQSKKLYGIRWE